MALSDLLAGLEAEAAAEEAQLEVETTAEVSRIEAAALSDARLLRQEVLREAEDDLRLQTEARHARARLAAAAAVRQAREDSFREFLDDVRGRLEAVRNSPSYPTVLRVLLREGLAALPKATVLRVDPRDELMAAHLLAELGVNLEIVATLQTAGGVELARGEDRAVRNTVEDRLENAQPALRLLFGEARQAINA